MKRPFTPGSVDTGCSGPDSGWLAQCLGKERSMTQEWSQRVRMPNGQAAEGPLTLAPPLAWTLFALFVDKVFIRA